MRGCSIGPRRLGLELHTPKWLGPPTEWMYHLEGRPILRDDLPRVVFCGEHTAIMQRGMEGAFESGERAAVGILTRI